MLKYTYQTERGAVALEFGFFLWEVLINLSSSVSIGFLLYRRLGRAPRGKLALILGTILHWAVVCGINFMDINWSWPIVSGVTVYPIRFIVMAISVAFAIIVFKGELSKKILWGLAPVLIMAIADYITCLIAMGILGADFESAFAWGGTRIPLTACFALLFAGACLILGFTAGKRSNRGIYIPISARIMLIAMLIIGTAATDILIDSAFAAAEAGAAGANIISSVIGVILLLLILMAFVLVVQIGFLSRKNMDYALEIRQKKLEHAYYHNLEIIIDSIQKFKHDMQSHMQTMQGLLLQEAYGELKEYFETADEKFRQMPRMYLTANQTINALLVSKAVIAETDATPFHYSANDALDAIRLVSLQYYDLCSILGNLLDNALEACRKLNVSQRYIKLTIEKREAMLIIRVENSYNGKYNKAQNTYLSDKAGAGHGIGLQSIAEALAQCGGHLVIAPTGNAFIASAFIPLNNQTI
ncbi:MAG: ATP-binding protein [Clostridiales bacterium]|nr:ATP-binding protein [Clostridiales bacterium]